MAAPRFSEYVAVGWAICAIGRAERGPTYPKWNETPIPADAADGLDGAGLLHVQSGTCALDIDNLDLATPWLASRGIDLKALLTATGAVQIVSDNPGHAKLLYRLKTPLRTLQPPGSGIELRCATAQGRSVQDILPPSIHWRTRKPYRWAYGEPSTGDWSLPPAIPAPILALWRSLLAEGPTIASKPTNGHAAEPIDIALPELHAWVATQPIGAPYDVWLKIGMKLHHATGGAEEGLALWESRSKEPKTCRAHWLSFSNPPGKIVATLRTELPASADEFPLIPIATPPPVDRDKLKKAATRQAQAEAILEKRLVYVLASERYFDMQRHQLVGSDAAIEHQFTSSMPRRNGAHINPVHVLKQSATKRRVEGLGFHPGEGALFTFGSDSYANLYRDRLPKPSEPTPLEVEKIEWLFARIDDDAYRHWLKQYFAHVVQRPAIKLRSAPLLWSEAEGNGKGTLIKSIPALLVGREYSHDADYAVLGTDFNDYAIGAWHINLVEFRAGSRGERTMINSKLKAYISDDEVTAHPKGGRTYTMPNHFFVTASSNDDDAASIGKNDRRWGVHELKALEYTEAERQWIYAEFLTLPRAAAVLRYYFLHIGLRGFDPAGSPPMTEAKRQMAQASRAADVELLERLFEERTQFFARDVVLLSEVQDYVHEHSVAKPSASRLGRILTKAPFEGHSVKLWVGRGTYRAVIVRNHARWESTPHKEIMAHIEGDDSLDLLS